MKKKARVILLNLLIAVSAISVVIALTATYMHRLVHSLEGETSATLQEVSSQSAALIRLRIDTDLRAIEAAAQSLSNSSLDILAPPVLRALERQRAYTNFQVMTVADPAGNAYAPDGNIRGNLSEQDYFKRAITAEHSLPVSIELAENGQTMAAAVPILRDGQIIGVTVGSYAVEEISRLLNVSVFNGQGFSYIANSDGNIFLRPDHPMADQAFYDLSTDFHSSRFRESSDLARMLEDLRNGRSGSVFYAWNGVDRIMAYQPIGINNWYLLTVIPKEIITARSFSLYQQTFWLISTVLGVFVLLTIYAFGRQHHDRARLRRAHENLTVLYNTLPGGVFRCRYDEKWTVVFANDGFYRFLGISREEFATRYHSCMMEVIHPKDLEATVASVSRQVRSGSTLTNENRLLLADGKIKWIWINAELEKNAAGEELFYCTFLDITSLKEAQEQLYINQQRYEIVLEQTQDILFEWDMHTREIYHSKNFYRKFGFEPPKQNFPQSIFESDVVPAEDKAVFLAIYCRLEEGARYSVGEFRIKNAQGSPIWCRVCVTAVLDEAGNSCRAVGLISDIDQQKRQLQQVEESAKRDALTRLYNKSSSEALVRDYLLHETTPAAMVVMDIDNFKGINDTLGHLHGDAVLSEIGRALQAHCRTSDLVGRVGGDEFIAFLPNMTAGVALESKAKELCSIFQQTFTGADSSYEVSGSLGISFYPQDGTSYEALFQKADTALYYAKRHGKNRFALYTADLEGQGSATPRKVPLPPEKIDQKD